MFRIVSITDFRKNIFSYLDRVTQTGEELEVEKDGKTIVKVVKVDDDPAERAKRVLKLLPKLAGIWKNIPQKEFDEVNEFMRGKKEIRYMKDLCKKVSW